MHILKDEEKEWKKDGDVDRKIEEDIRKVYGWIKRNGKEDDKKRK
jgi:hypothetical protein